MTYKATKTQKKQKHNRFFNFLLFIIFSVVEALCCWQSSCSLGNLHPKTNDIVFRL